MSSKKIAKTNAARLLERLDELQALLRQVL